MGTISTKIESIILDSVTYCALSVAQSELKDRFINNHLDSRKWAAERLSFTFNSAVTFATLNKKRPTVIFSGQLKYKEEEFKELKESLSNILNYLAKNNSFNPCFDLSYTTVKADHISIPNTITLYGDPSKAVPVLLPPMSIEENDIYDEDIMDDDFDIEDIINSSPLPQVDIIKNPLIKDAEKPYIYDFITAGSSTQESLKHKYEQVNKFIGCTVHHSNVLEDMSEEELYEYFRDGLKKNNIPDNITNLLIAEVLHYKRDGVFSPIIFHGPRGVGKTEAATRIAKLFNLPFNKIEAPSAASSCGMKGTDSHYSSSDVGALADTMIRYNCINPVILIDEIDKAPKATGNACNLQDELLSICDKSRSIKDLFLNLTVDSSRCIFFFTANDLNNVSPYLLDRCKVIEYPDINYEKINVIAINHLKEEYEKQRYNERVELNMELIESGLKKLWKDGIKSFRPYTQFVSSTLKYAYIDSLANRKKLQINEHHTKLALDEFKNSYTRRHFGFEVN